MGDPKLPLVNETDCFNVCFLFLLIAIPLTSAPRPDTSSPVLPVPVWPHRLNLVHGGGTPHAMEALPGAAVGQRAVGAGGVWVEAESVMGSNTGRGLGQRAHQLPSVWGVGGSDRLGE